MATHKEKRTARGSCKNVYDALGSHHNERHEFCKRTGGRCCVPCSLIIISYNGPVIAVRHQQ